MTAQAAARLAWAMWAAVVAILVGGAISYATRSGAETGDTLWDLLGTGLAMLTFASVGALIAARRPENSIGWVFGAGAVSLALAVASNEYAVRGLLIDPGSVPLAVWAAWANTWVWFIALGLFAVYAPLLFPTGSLPSRRWRPVAWLGGFSVAAAAVSFALRPGPIDAEFYGPYANPLGIPGATPILEALEMAGLVGVILSLLAATASPFVRLRRARGDERQQIKWFLFAVSVAAIGIAVGATTQAVAPAVSDIGWNVGLLGLIGMPIAAAVAILKYRLYDIDVVINKTVVYGLLAAFVTAVYVGIVVGIGALVGARGNVLLSIVATAVIAVAFQPARQRARHLANRLVYGERATPYEVLSEFSDRVGTSYADEDVLPRMARLVAEGVGATRADVWLRVGAELRRVASWPFEVPGSVLPVRGGRLPDIEDADRSFAIREGLELLGALSVVKPRQEPLTPAEEKLLADLAGQAGLILRNVRLIEELRASRQRLVAAQDEERRRLERNIHDGAQQQLVALAVKMRLVESLAVTDPPKAATMAAQAKAETQQALEDLRDLARGIYPPLLADKGLAAALEAQARKAPLPVQVDSNGMGRYPQEAEAAVYFCVLEALQNVAKYAEASTARLQLRHEDGQLVFIVSDDGRGFDVETTAKGAGLQNMADRLDALGGSVEIASSPGAGTTVTGRIPVR
jgi:signal transduction histidine kinase